jgi:hypothetical protein
MTTVQLPAWLWPRGNGQICKNLKLNFRFWPKADIPSRIAKCLLLGVKRT